MDDAAAAARKKERQDEEQSILPDDIIFATLLSLPFMQVIQLRCVSKTWYTLLTDPQFLKLHRLRHNRPHRLMMLSHSPSRFQSINFEEETPINVPTIVQNHPPAGATGGISFRGSCEGFILLHKPKPDALFLWNPTARATIELPDPPKNLKFKANFLLCGLGFDPLSHDFKILIIDNRCKYAQLYSRKTNSWKTVTEKALKSFGYVAGGGIFVSGCLHWSTRPIKGKDEKIVSFDLAREKFKIAPAPFDATNVELSIQNELPFQNELPIQVCALEGLLCVVNYGNFGWDLWVMKEYGAEESWTKLITSRAIKMWCKPLCLIDNGEVILYVFDRRIVKYNPKAKAGEEFKTLMENEFGMDSIMFSETTQFK